MKTCHKYLIFLLFFGGISLESHADDISRDVYPSEEELYESYVRGDIEYETYLNLVEIFEDGVDSTEIYLLNEIPNINSVLFPGRGNLSSLENEQLESFIISAEPADAGQWHGFMRLRGYQRLEEKGDNKAFVTFKNRVGNELSWDIRYSENYSGNRTITRRNIKYTGGSRSVKKIMFGNYTARFGLGLAVGYRGKLLDKDDMEFKNSVFFPKYGGFNGVYIEGGREEDEIKAMIHFDRNNDHAVGLAALDLVKHFNNFQFDGIVLGSSVRDRTGSADYNFLHLGFFAKYKNDPFTASVETAYRKNTRHMIPAFAAESRYISQHFNVNLLAWHFSDDFINLSGGAYAGSYYQTLEIDTVEFSFRDKRIGQDGFLLKTLTALKKDLKYDASLTVYGKDRFNRRTKLLTGVEYSLLDHSTIRLDYYYQRDIETDSFESSQGIRAEYQLYVSDFNLRSYIGYDERRGESFLSWFNRIRYNSLDYGMLELWLNLSRLDYRNSQVDYFYGYIKESFNLTSGIELAAKYSYRYNRTSNDRYLPTFMLETKVIW